MKTLLALAIALLVAVGAVGVVAAQAPSPTPAEKKTETKKMPVKNANGMVKSASADSIVVAGKQKNKEVEWTFAVEPKTSIRRGGKSITAADLKPGDSIHVRYMDVDGKAVAQSIMAKGGGKKK